jgi:hypothetical protein
MTNDLGADLTSLETRLNIVEQQGVVARTPSVTVVPGAGGTPTARDSLTFDAGWVNHTKLISGQPNPALPNYPSMSWVHYTNAATFYGPAEAIRIGPMCFLTGMVVRTGAQAVGGERICMLPTGWRPRFRYFQSCIMSGGSPAFALLEVRPDTSASAGGLYFNNGQLALGTNGWLGLEGHFPCIDAPLP